MIGICSALGDQCADAVRHHLQQDRIRARLFQDAGILHDARRARRILALHAEPALGSMRSAGSTQVAHAGIPAATIPTIRSAISRPPSSFTASQAASAMKRPALRIADSTEGW